MASFKRSKTDARDDTISHCGSICGETYVTSRPRNSCSLRQHSRGGSLALRNKFRGVIPVDAESVQDESIQDATSNYGGKKRINTCFHNFRFIVVAFGGVSIGVMVILRYSITVAILKMVNQTALYLEEHPNNSVEDFLAEGHELGGEFNWNNEIQQMIMSWYMIAYTLPQVPCTKLGKKIGLRLAVPISVFTCAAATLLTPSAAYLGWQYVVALRLIHGIGASAIFPLLLTLIENWMGYDEMSLGLTCAQILQATLTATNPLLSGYLADIHWSYAFYIPGVASLLFCIAWLILITETPDDNWLISEKELGIICGCNDYTEDVHDQNSNQPNPKGVATETRKKSATDDGPPDAAHPEHQLGALDIFKTPSFYAYPVMWIFYCSSQACFFFILPAYLQEFLKFDISSNGIYCFIIMSGTLVSVLWPHAFLRLLKTRLSLSTTAAGRVTSAIICFMSSLTWFYVGAFHDTQLIMLFVNRCFHSSNDIVVTSAIMSNYAKSGLSSLAFSMANTVGCLSVVFASAVVGYVLDHSEQSDAAWSSIYYAMAAAQLVILAIFCTIVTSEPVEFKRQRHDKHDGHQQKAGHLDDVKLDIAGLKESK